MSSNKFFEGCSNNFHLKLISHYFCSSSSLISIMSIPEVSDKQSIPLLCQFARPATISTGTLDVTTIALAC